MIAGTEWKKPGADGGGVSLAAHVVSKPPPALLEIRDLCISYRTRAGDIPAVKDFSLTLQKGGSVGLVGESGCGKSTVAMGIMRHMGRNGLFVGGTICFNGRDMAELSSKELTQLRGTEIAMIYQEPFSALNPSLTIATQLMEVPIEHEGSSAAEARERALGILDDVQLPDPERILKSYPHQLSGGQQQRVVIAIALLGRPSLLILDEPTTALDVTVEAGIVKLIAGISSRHGTSLLYISHNLGLLQETCARICVMYSGEVVEEGSGSTLFADPKHPYTRGLFGCIPLPSADKHSCPLKAIPGQLPLPHERPTGCNFWPRCGHYKKGVCDTSDVKMVRIGSYSDRKSGRVRCLRWQEIGDEKEVPASAGKGKDKFGDVLMSAEKLCKFYEIRDKSMAAIISGRKARLVKANMDIEFDVKCGETVSIVGESGCGKSTFARVLMGLEKATRGTLLFEGKDISALPVRRRGQKLLGALQMVFQNPNETLNPSHTVGAQIARVVRKFGIESDREKAKERMLRLLDLVKLPREFAMRKPRQLSGGQKQRVGIARAFAGEADMIVADEPVSALDVSVQAAITELLVDLQRDKGTTLLFISHDLGVVRYLSDRIVVMYLGRIMEHGPTAKIFAPPYHPYTEALLAAAPVADPTIKKREIVLSGQPPSAIEDLPGCPFASRCPRKVGKVCDTDRPPLQKNAEDHMIACHIPLPELKKVEPVFLLAADYD